MDNNLKQRKMKVRTLFTILFASVCAGCFGMEDMVGASGPGLTLLIIIVIPLIWAAPIALSCAEIGSGCTFSSSLNCHRTEIWKLFSVSGLTEHLLHILRKRRGENHGLPCDGMAEFQAAGMERLPADEGFVRIIEKVPD